MPEIYIYISDAKVQLLSEQNPAFWSKVTAKIDFKLLFLSGGLSGTTDTRTLPELRRILPLLHREYEIPVFTNIDSNNVPVFFSFQGPAVRTIDDDQFWLAMESDRTALLLAGSASHALGDNVMTGSDRISPSADPVGSFRRAAMKNDRNTGKELESNLSYMWQELMKESIRGGISLPHVEGIAVFGAKLKTAKGQMRRVNRVSLGSLIIGTPLYVKQSVA
jgi:hypothetical protein